MKYLKITLLAVIFLAVSCEKIKYQDRYMAYDAVNLFQEPFDDAAVVAKVSTVKKPNGYRYDKSNPHFYLSDTYNVGKPLRIVETDDTGEWGFVEIMDFDKTCSGWVKLSQLVYAGNSNPKTTMAAYVVKSKKVPLYKRPKSTNALSYWLVQGDTVVVWVKGADGWAHVSNYKYHQRMGDSERFGWTKLSLLSPIDSFSRAGLNRARQESKIQQMTQKQVTNIEETRKELGGAALLALILALVLSFSAKKRRKIVPMWIEMSLCVIVLVGRMLTYGQEAPYGLHILTHLFDYLAGLCIIWVLLYPLLYVRFISRIWKYLFMVAGIYISIGASVGLMNPVAVVIVSLVGIGIAFKIAKNTSKDICTNCGYYAAHTKLGYTSEGGETSREDWRETTKRGGTTISTRDYTVIKGWRRGTTERSCMRCGETFENVETWTTRREINR